MGPLAWLYLLFNVGSVSGVVFANKAVFAVHAFNFPYALTCIHAVVTYGGMFLFRKAGMYEPKPVPKQRLVTLAALYVGYIVFGNLNLKYNTVGFYQITKLAIAPCAMVLEVVFANAPKPSLKIIGSVMLVVSGIGICTLTDTQEVGTSTLGMAVGLGAVVCSAGYTVWVGKLQKELSLSSMQLLNEYAPIAIGMLTILLLGTEPLGMTAEPSEATLLGYPYSITNVGMITLSAVLGLAVSLSTFLLIGATSALTYNVVGHIKTVTILTGGVLIFGETISVKKVLGVACAMGGIIWFTNLKKAEAAAAKLASGTAAPSSEKGASSEEAPMLPKA